MNRWKYAIESQRRDGAWCHGTTWECYPSHFRALLRYINGDDNPDTGQVVVDTQGPPTRIKRIDDDVEPDFKWPEDKVRELNV